MTIFYELDNIPVHSVLLMDTREKALGYPRGRIRLGFCKICGFISNTAYDPNLNEYSESYEETQGYSPTFNSFHTRLANRLIEKYDLHHKNVIEIGCGKGEFLTLLCELGDNSGIGFDPAYVDERNHSSARDRIKFINDFYSERYTDYKGDFVACKMTLEHIPQTADFIRTLRRSLDKQTGTIVFFQVPDVMRILRHQAFEDIYYEHCSYFSPGSLARLFRQHGFEVLDIWTDYDDQYLMIEAKISDAEIAPDGAGVTPLAQEESLEELAEAVECFTDNITTKLADWRRDLAEFEANGQRVVLWGSGSKAVTFFSTFKEAQDIKYAVDINPHRQGTYITGTGQLIVGPEFLAEYQPDVVILMNRIYREEIQRDLTRLKLSPQVLAI